MLRQLITFGTLALVFGALVWADTYNSGHESINRAALAFAVIGACMLALAIGMEKLGNYFQKRQKAASQE